MRGLSCIVVVVVLGCGGVSSRPTTLVARDTEAVLNIVERYFGPRIFTAPLAWQTFLETIRAVDVPVDFSNAEMEAAYCDAMANALLRQGIFLSRRMTESQEYQRCGSSTQDVATEPSTGPLWNDGEYVRIEEMREDDARVVTMQLRFSGPDSSYQSAHDLIVRAGSETAFLVDLRGASGADIRAAWTLVLAFLDRANATPLATIVQPLARRLIFDETLPNFADWQALVGIARAPIDTAAGPWRSRFAGITVLVDHACDQACEIFARTLDEYAGADIAGRVRSRSRLGGFAWSQTTLPQSGFRLEFPAAAMAMYSSSTEVVMREWVDVDFSIPAANLASDHHAIDQQARASLGARSRSAMRTAHFLVTPPPSCASFGEISAQDFPASNVFAKIEDWTLHNASEPPTTAVHLYLPPPEAHAYLSECAGIQAHWSLPWNDGTTMVLVAWQRVESLTRLVQSPVVARIQFERAAHNSINQTLSE